METSINDARKYNPQSHWTTDSLEQLLNKPMTKDQHIAGEY